MSELKEAWKKRKSFIDEEVEKFMLGADSHPQVTHMGGFGQGWKAAQAKLTASQERETELKELLNEARDELDRNGSYPLVDKIDKLLEIKT